MRFPEVSLRFLSHVPIDAGTDVSADSGNPSEWTRYIRTTDISNLTVLDQAKRVTVPDEVARLAPVQRDDILMTRAGSIGTTYIHESDEPAAHAGYLVRWRVDRAKAWPKYMAYWTQSRHFQGQVAAGVVRSTIDNYSASKYRSTRAPVPALDEQRRIAEFLDTETAQIDDLIAEQEQFIQFLIERRSVALVQILSGAGEPVKLKFLVDTSRQITYGIVQVGDRVEGGAPYIDPRDLVGHRIDSDAARLGTTQPEIDHAYRRSRVAAGDIAVSIGPGFGKTAVIPEGLDGVNITRDVARVACNERIALSRYVAWVLKSPIATGFWDRQITGSTFRRLNLDNLSLTPIPLPNIQMQRSICDRLERETAALDALIAEAEYNVALSKERRAALITAAVTGQIDVSTDQGA